MPHLPIRPGHLRQRPALVPVLAARLTAALLPQRSRSRPRLAQALAERRLRRVPRVLRQPRLKLSDPLSCRPAPPVSPPARLGHPAAAGAATPPAQPARHTPAVLDQRAHPDTTAQDQQVRTIRIICVPTQPRTVTPRSKEPDRLRARQVGPIPEPVIGEPQPRGTWLSELQYARDRGRLLDLSEIPFRRRLRFQRQEGDPRHWWNGLLYSRFQLLVLPELRPVLSRRRYRRRNEQVVSWLPTPHEFVLERAVKFRRIAVVLAALEARYLSESAFSDDGRQAVAVTADRCSSQYPQLRSGSVGTGRAPLPSPPDRLVVTCRHTPS